MAESVLSKLVKTDKETKERLVSIDNTLQKILLNDQKIAKIEEKRYKREQQSNKRKSGDKTLTGKILGGRERDKKEKKGFLDGLQGLFKNLSIAGILSKLGLGALIGSYILSPGFRKLVKDNILKPLGGVIKEGLIGKDGIFGKKNRDKAWKWMKDNPLKTLQLAAAGLALIIGPKSLVFLGMKALGSGLGLVTKAIGVGGGGLLSLLGKLSLSLKGISTAAAATKGALMALGAGLGAKILALVAAPIGLAAGAGSIHKNIQYRRAGGKAGMGDLLNEIKDERLKFNRENPVGQGRSGAKAREERNKANEGYRERLKLEREIMEANRELNEARKAATKIERTGPRGRNRTVTVDQEAIDAAELKYYKKKEELIERFESLDPLKRQSGGPITVPGSSTGDKHPALLPPGSFVLNRNASGYQMGGIPAMLESGEKVYGPGQWGPREMMLNSAVPRFQEGGLVLPDWGAPTPKSSLVEASHPDTGTGWSVGKDAHNRPAVFSKSAAEALLQAIKDSNGAVKASDITSSTRTPAKNAAVKGAPNSNHLHGNAVDIHGTSKSWLKQNGMKYGWKHLVYSGHDGHFDFIKGGALPVQDRDDTSSQDSKVGGQSIMNNLMKLGGQVGQFFKEIMSVIGGALGDSGLMSFLFGGGSGSGPNIEGLSTYSEPLTGDSASKAKDMFEYIVEKGYSKAQAKGIVANIQRESGFDIDAVGDGGSSHGLFQWHADRASRMKAAVPDYANNWKAQIDYALQEHVGPQYKSSTAGMNAKDAAYWWMNKWEIPADRARGGPNHNKMNGFIDSYGFQKGGVVNMRGSGSGPDISQKSENQFIEKLSSAMSPVVVPVPMGVGGGGGTSGSHEVSRSIPSLSANPSNSVALDLAYRLSVGASFS